MMRDYKKYRGRDVSVMTPDGSFQGRLEEVGRTTLTLRVERWFYDNGQPAPEFKGLALIQCESIRFVQVR